MKTNSMARAWGKAVLRGILRPLFRVTVSGDSRMFLNERTLIVANHESFLDGLLLAVFLPVDATFVVHAQIKSHWLFRWLLPIVPHLAVDSANPLAIKLICRLVETGRPVVIFPEGRPVSTRRQMSLMARGLAESTARCGTMGSSQRKSQ